MSDRDMVMQIITDRIEHLTEELEDIDTALDIDSYMETFMRKEELIFILNEIKHATGGIINEEKT